MVSSLAQNKENAMSLTLVKLHSSHVSFGCREGHNIACMLLHAVGQVLHVIKKSDGVDLLSVPVMVGLKVKDYNLPAILKD